MLKKLRKSSSEVTLVLIGLAALGGLAGCSQDETRRRPAGASPSTPGKPDKAQW